MPNLNTTISIDLTPDQMRTLEPLLVLADFAAMHNQRGAIYARILPVGIADCDFRQIRETKREFRVIVPKQSPDRRASVEPFRSATAVTCRFGDNTMISLDDADKGETDDLRQTLAA